MRYVGCLISFFSEELGVRNEEWRKGRTIRKTPQYPPFIKVIILLTSISNRITYTAAIEVKQVIKGYARTVIS